MFIKPTYIVFDVSGSVADEVREIRKKLDPERANLNIEISISGSSGLGYVAPEQPLDIICHQLTEVCKRIVPFWCNFNDIKNFNNTNIYYFTIKNKQPFFDAIDILKSSNIKFLPTPYEYEPHCTLTLPAEKNNTNNNKHIAGIEKIIIPKDNLFINSLALYEEIKPNSFVTIFRKKLGLN